MSQPADDSTGGGDRPQSGSVTSRLAPEARRGRSPQPTQLPPPGGLRAAVAGWWRSRYGARSVKEVGGIVALLLLYRLGRMLGRHQSTQAFDNAHHLLRVEERLGIDTELSLHGPRSATRASSGCSTATTRPCTSGRRWPSSSSSMCGDPSCGLTTAMGRRSPTCWIPREATKNCIDRPRRSPVGWAISSMA